MKLNPYLHFNGDCEAAFKFYERALNGKDLMMMTYASTPMADKTPTQWLQKIIHARLTVGDGGVLMGADSPPQRYEKPAGFSVSLNLNDPAEAERVFSALSEGGAVTMPLAQTFWAKRFGMFVDQFGVSWMVNCE